jgi:UDP-N-acetylmuramate--alanine ligase
MTFDVFEHQELLGRVTLNVPGMHNVRNALAAIAVGLELDMPFEQIRDGLEAFSGVQRRMHEIGYARGVRVVDDYAHHPTEIRATLEAASECWPESRIVAVFQPHLYSRTRDFQEAFARAFFNADVLVMMDVYGAREEPIEGVDGSIVADLARSFGHREVHYVRDREKMPAFVASLVRSGDVVLTLGAGDIWRYSRRLVEALEAGGEGETAKEESLTDHSDGSESN